MSDTSHFQTILNRFFPAAVDLCNEILDFQPDLVICLMHSGWLPLYAGLELWKQTQPAPFPPVVRANLGREKFERYNVLENRPRITAVFDGTYEEDHGQAFFLAWLCDQKHWQAELQEMIRERLGDVTPRRILVVDDFICEGGTWMLALGLLKRIFPEAEVRLNNANIEFKHAFLEEWAKRYHPELLASGLIPRPGESWGEDYNAAGQMGLGTEDLGRESLRWKVIGPPSPTLDALSIYLPAADWLELPRFAEQTVRAEVAARAAEYTPGPGPTKQWYPGFKPGILILRELYRHGPLTLQEISKHLGWSMGKTRYNVERQIEREYLVVQRDSRPSRIALSPSTDPRYYDQPHEFDTYWVMPGRLLAGELPGYNIEGPEKESMLARLQCLLDAGVTFFIDLSSQTPGDLESYEQELMKLAAEHKKEVKYTAMSMPPRQLPRARTIRSILHMIDQALAQGHTLYIHDHHLGRMTETILGCYFVQHGMQGPDALKELERVRQGSREGWRRAPVTENARRLVRRWADRANNK